MELPEIMCGIAGILGRLSDELEDAAARMNHAMAHRGPDGQGLWRSPADKQGRGCILAHRRLSILDLSTASSQPIVDTAYRTTMVFNGEIYNYQDVRKQLEARGEQFRTSGDSEVLLRLISLDGAAGLPALRGMFAFAIWDDRTRTLRVARDGFGIKPLYIVRNPDAAGDWTLAFASEVRALLASRLLPRPRLDRNGLATFLWNGFVVGPQTIVEGISLFPSGESSEYNVEGHSIANRRFWSLDPASAGRVSDENTIADALGDSVQSHLVSDVPVGIFLSAGVDSAAVANLASQRRGGPIHTFTLGVDDHSLNEATRAREIAKAIGSHHTEATLDEAAFVGGLDQAIETLDQPTFDGINTYYMSRAVRENGIHVALVGTGGDELFGGYRSFADLPRLLRWQQRTAWVPEQLKVGAANALQRLKALQVGDMPPQTRWAKLPDLMRAGDDMIRLYQLAYAIFLPSFQSQLMGDPGINGAVQDGLPAAFRERLAEEIRGASPLRAISILEQRCFLGQRLLRDTDAASMAVSLETRLPLVDTHLCDILSGVPDERRYQPIGRKDMLRRCGHRGLDPQLFNAPKTGFVLPFDRWMRRGLGAAMESAMSDHGLIKEVGLSPGPVTRLWQASRDSSPGLYWSRAWAIFVLIRWCHRHGVLA